MPPFQHRVLVEQPEFHPCRDNTHAFYFIGFEEQGTVIYRPALVRGHGVMEFSGCPMLPYLTRFRPVYICKLVETSIQIRCPTTCVEVFPWVSYIIITP